METDGGAGGTAAAAAIQLGPWQARESGQRCRLGVTLYCSSNLSAQASTCGTRYSSREIFLTEKHLKDEILIFVGFRAILDFIGFCRLYDEMNGRSQPQVVYAMQYFQL